MARSALRTAAVLTVASLVLVVGCGGGGGQDEDDVVVSIGSLGDLATGPTTRPIQEALNDGDCGAIPQTSDATEVLVLACEAGESTDTEAWSIASDALTNAEVDPDAPDAAVQREILEKLRPILEERATTGGGRIEFQRSSGTDTTATTSDTTDTTSDTTTDTGSITAETDVTIPDTTASVDTTAPATTVR